VSQNSWQVHKFGGSSLADANCFKRVAEIIANSHDAGRSAVVVSAMGGMTNSLLALATTAEDKREDVKKPLMAIGERFSAAAQELVSDDARQALLESWSKDAHDIEDILRAITLLGSAPQRSRDVIAGYGELWSARLLAAHLSETLGADRAGRWVDTRELIVVRHSELGPTVLWDKSRENHAELLADLPASQIVVFTGFIAVDETGLHTTLGRNGSDYSAAIIAALTNADQLTIWTDVDGILSADPNQVPDARVIRQMSYSEAMELAYFGAKVIHPQTLGPVIDSGIDVTIRNTFDKDGPGSRIGNQPDADDPIKGITAVSDMALINVEGAGMIGVPGTADRLFAALKADGVSVTLISQASSEHSICIAVANDAAERAREVITSAFAMELSSGQINSVEVMPNQSIVAVVGDGMTGSPGVAARFFSNLGRAGINIRAIAQGSSERNISAVIDSADTTRALRVVHSGFYLSAKTLSVGVIGCGVVGATLLDLIRSESSRLQKKFNLDIRVRGIARSQKMLLADKRIDMSDWRSALNESTSATNFDQFADHVHADHIPHAVIVDCTADDLVAANYSAWLSRGIHIVTPNKKAFSAPADEFERLKPSSEEGRSRILYETTVGAALPIIKTIRDLIDTGDRIQSLNGILSGTLAYLFNVYDASVPFSEVVSKARAAGFTEPDPRDDLSGMDVARKLTILAREMGLPLSIGEFPVENLIPDELRSLDVDEFMAELPRYDQAMEDRYRAARADNMNLRYVASLDADGTAKVGLMAVDADNAFSHLQLTDNIVQFKTERYSSNPLVIQGPGAGPEVTAGGVFGDLLSLAASLEHGALS